MKSYLENIKFILKTGKFWDKVGIIQQIYASNFKKGRVDEYFKQIVEPSQVLLKFFPDENPDPKIFCELENHLKNFTLEKIGNSKKIENAYPERYGLTRSMCRFLSSLCLYSKPEIVIETGVANGFSSSYILFALDLLNKGKLISIDYLARPEQTKEKVGAAIPSHLRKRQQLFIDKATRVLKKFTQNSLKVDIFVHDSIHTYHNMIEEFDIIWPHIKKKGFLLSDDVTDNDAFLDFADRMQKKPFIMSYKKSRPFGLIQK